MTCSGRAYTRPQCAPETHSRRRKRARERERERKGHPDADDAPVEVDFALSARHGEDAGKEKGKGENIVCQTGLR